MVGLQILNAIGVLDSLGAQGRPLSCVDWLGWFSHIYGSGAEFVLRGGLVIGIELFLLGLLVFVLLHGHGFNGGLLLFVEVSDPVLEGNAQLLQ